MQNPVKIGEGTYGCVFKPSMNCKPGSIMPPGFNNNEYISKFMKKIHAQEELNEFNKFNVIDPNNEFHLGKQFICDPEYNSKVKQQISTCQNINLSDVETNLFDYKLLIGKYGGPDLKNFCEQYDVSYFLKNQTPQQQKYKKDKFLLEILHLLKGLKFFKDNNLVHYDLKPHNILFNLNDGSMKFIDFGLMRGKNKIKEDSRNNSNWLGTFHWSYPLETGFLNFSDFDSVHNIPETTMDNIINDMYLQISSGSTLNNGLFPIKNPGGFLNMFTNYLYIQSKPELFSLLSKFKNFFHFIKNKPYDFVLDYTIDRIDIYGLGISLNYLINCLYNHKILNESELNELTEFLKQMINFDTYKQNVNINDLINKYEKLLQKLNVQKIMLQKSCGHKELNPNTGRCVKKCEPGYSRDSNFKCKKISKNLSITQNKNTNQITKKMPYLTKYQIPITNPNTSENAVFVPYPSPISYKNSSSNQYINKLADFVIQCGPGKELNPRTNKCTNKCKPGYKRNFNFKCVKYKKESKKTRRKYK